MMRRGLVVGWFYVAIALTCAVSSEAETFVNKKTKQQLQGQFMGAAIKDHRKVLLVKTPAALLQLPAAEWELVKVAKADAQQAPAAGGKKPFKWPEIRYGGEVRDSAWLERAYKALSEQVIVCEGVAVNRQSVPWVGSSSAHRSVGQIFQASGTVTQVLEDGRMLTSLANSQGVLMEGAATEGWTDGKGWRATLVSVGTHQYITVLGAQRTILRCHIVSDNQPKVTRWQFSKALENGVALYTWRRCVKCGGRGYVYVRKWRKSGMNRESYTTKKRCPGCHGKKRFRVDLSKSR